MDLSKQNKMYTIMVSGKMGSGMAEENNSGLMAQYMKETGLMTWHVDKED